MFPGALFVRSPNLSGLTFYVLCIVSASVLFLGICVVCFPKSETFRGYFIVLVCAVIVSH